MTLGDTFKVTTASLNAFNANLEKLAEDIEGNTYVQQLTQWTTDAKSPLKGGVDGVAADLYKDMTSFATRMSDSSAGIKSQSAALGVKIRETAERFDSTNKDGEWSAEQVGNLVSSLETGTGTGSGNGNTPAAP